MMKKLTIIILFLFNILPLFAQIPPNQVEGEYLSHSSSQDKVSEDFLWGALHDYNRNYNKYYGLGLALNTGGLVFSLIEEGTWQKPTNISNKDLAVKNKAENALNAAKREEELSNMINKAFRVWFDDTKAEIEKTHRQQEFKDIMQILNKSVKPTKDKKDLELAKKNNLPILHFLFTTENNMHKLCRAEWAAGCNIYHREGAEIVIVNPYTSQKSEYHSKTQIYQTLIHEIGHYYGLSDQYKLSASNSDSEYSTEDRVRDYTSVMAAGNFNHLRCDDIDGFINLIDLTLSKQNNNKFSARAKNGWASFCNGKKGYKDTYYKDAKPVNKKTDACVYDVDSNGKVGKKYCPKLWTFHRQQDKLTYGKNDLITEKQDEKFNYKYSYSKGKGNNTINISLTGKQNKTFTSAKKTFDGKQAWELPQGYYVKIFPDKISYIYTDNNTCNLVNYTPFSDSKSYSLSFINNKLEEDYKYSFNLANNVIVLDKHTTLAHPVCTVYKEEFEMIKFVGSAFGESMGKVSKNKYILDRVAQSAGMTRDQLIDRLKTECKKDLHQSIIDNAKDLCGYFRKVDNYFQ